MARDAHITLEKLVFDRLSEKHGRGNALTQRPIMAGSTLTIDEPADPLAAITEAAQLQRVAGSLAAKYALQARGKGASWKDLVEPLGIDTSDEWADPPADAFKMVAHKPSMPFDRVYTSWRCASCGEGVTDYGPYNGHPVDDERGHAEGCERHAREIAAYRKMHGFGDE